MTGNPMPMVHVVGAGLAGLSAATLLSKRGYRVQVYESTGYGGGRCRSYHDERLGCVVDNGNHLILSGNSSTQDYLSRIGALNRLVAADRAVFPFMDISTGERWSLDLGAGTGLCRLVTNGMGNSLRKGAYGIPGVSFRDTLSAFRFCRASENSTVYDQVGSRGLIYHRLWEPLSIAILNTEPQSAKAQAMWPVLRETLGVGPEACRPLLAKQGLGHALVDPAIDYLQRADANLHFNAPVKSIEVEGNRAAVIHFPDRSVTVEGDDRVILALPIATINTLLPSLPTPTEYRPIINAHFEVSVKNDKLTVLGLINGDAHWVFRRNSIASVTVSAATSLVDEPADRIAAILWRDVCKALELGDAPLGKHRIIKEKRATFAQTPKQDKRRPEAKTALDNLFLAGDWTATGLPATIEGAIRSGKTAANLCY